MKRKSFFVLMFHGIVTTKPEYFLYRPSENCFVRQSDFEKIIKYCKKRYRILKVDELDQYFDGTATEDGVLITFDDGLQSLYTLGLPVLKKYGANATVFITPGWTGTNEEPAIFSLEYHLYHHHTPSLIKVSVDNFSFEKQVNDKNDIPIVIGALWDRLFEEKISPLSIMQEQLTINGNSLRNFKRSNPEEWKPISWELLRKTYNDGTIEIGAHGQTHTPFTWLQNEQLEKEVIESKAQLLRELDSNVISCSFPHGLYNERTLETVARHFEYGFTNTMVNDADRMNKANIPRYNVPYQRPNNIPSLIGYPFLGKVLRKIGHLSKLY